MFVHRLHAWHFKGVTDGCELAAWVLGIGVRCSQKSGRHAHLLSHVSSPSSPSLPAEHEIPPLAEER